MSNKNETKNVNEANNNIHRLDPNLINALIKQGVNIEDLGIVEKGTRIKTDSKLTEMETQNPEMFAMYNAMKDLHNPKERFDYNGTEYKITLTIKKA